MSDLRALLGDRYEAVIEQAWQSFLADGSGLGTRVDLTKALEAVLPDLLAAAWDEGRKLGLRQADWEYNVTPDPMPDLVNPYRPETATTSNHAATTCKPDPTGA